MSLSVHNIILAHSISLPGYLPIEVTNAVPTDPIVLNAPPPPLPPRCDEDNRAAPQSPALDRGDREEQPPPIPVKSARIMPRSVSLYSEGMVFPLCNILYYIIIFENNSLLFH